MAGQNHDGRRRSALMILFRHNSVSILAVACLTAPVIGRCESATNKSLTTLQRLERPHLQAAHEARLGFERARRPMLSHGVNEDFRVIVCVQPGHDLRLQQTRRELLAAARKARISVVLLTERGKPRTDTWCGLLENVLFIPYLEAGEDALWFPDYGADGKPIADSGFRFLTRIAERAEAPSAGIAGMAICNRQTDNALDKDLQRFLTLASVDA